MLIKTEKKNTSNEIVSKDSVLYEEYPNSTTVPLPDWPEGIYQIRAVKRYDTLDGVGTYTTYEYNNTNGNVKYTVDRDHNGTKLTTRAIYACDTDVPYSSDFKTNNMLSQVVQKTLYKQSSASTGYPGASNAISSTVTTYKKNTTTGYYLPCSTLVWDEKTTTSGLPSFDYSDFTNNNYDKWKLQTAYSNFSTSGMVQELKDANKNSSVNVYGHNGSLTIAQVQNALYKECAFLPGDYDDNKTVSSTAYFDYNNRWKKNGSSIAAPPVKHFGEKTVYINTTDKGPAKSISGIVPDQDFLFSAWVYPVIVSTSKPVKMKVIKSTTSSDPVPGDIDWASLESGKWNYISRIIPK